MYSTLQGLGDNALENIQFYCGPKKSKQGRPYAQHKDYKKRENTEEVKDRRPLASETTSTRQGDPDFPTDSLPETDNLAHGPISADELVTGGDYGTLLQFPSM